MKQIIAWRLVMFIQWLRIILYARLFTNKVIIKAKFNQSALMIGNGLIEFENNVRLGYFPSPFFLSSYAHLETKNKLCSIKIGKDTYINNNFFAIAEHRSSLLESVVLLELMLIFMIQTFMESKFQSVRYHITKWQSPWLLKMKYLSGHM